MPPVRTVPQLDVPLMKLVVRYQGYTTAVFTAWHRVAGVRLHHSINHAWTSGILALLPIQMCPPRWSPRPQNAAARNAPGYEPPHKGKISYTKSQDVYILAVFRATHTGAFLAAAVWGGLASGVARSVFGGKNFG